MWDSREEFETKSIGALALGKLNPLSYRELLTVGAVLLNSITTAKYKLVVGDDEYYIFEFPDHSCIAYHFDGDKGLDLTLGLAVPKGMEYPEWYGDMDIDPSLRDLIAEQREHNNKRKDVN